MKLKYNHKAVAPIIATLLMVAIAVVGGILIFVFTQGFFADGQVVGASVDELRIFGYDARDITVLSTHNAHGINGNTVNGVLDDEDVLAVYVRNLGDSVVVIESVYVFGESYDGVYTSDSSSLTSGNFCVVTIETEDTCSTSGIIEANDDASVVLAYDVDDVGTIKMGRIIIVALTTANGNTFTHQLQNGASEGRSSVQQ